jgi:hypothetical protein
LIYVTSQAAAMPHRAGAHRRVIASGGAAGGDRRDRAPAGRAGADGTAPPAMRSRG